MSSDSEAPHLLVRDTRSGTEIRVPINAGNQTIASSAFAGIKLTQTMPMPLVSQTTPLRLFDPGFKNTVACVSKVSRVVGCGQGEGDGTLLYRGFSIDQLVSESSFLEVAFLLIYGNLPSKAEYADWSNAVLDHTYIHAELEKQMKTFRYDAHPMGMLIATVASLSTFHPDANPALQGDAMYMKPKGVAFDDPKVAKAIANRNRAITRILGKVPTVASHAYRNRIGRTYNAPMPNCTNYAENFLYMIDKLNEPNYVPNPYIVKILDKMFILLAEHGSNCSTITMRHLTSSGVDPYSALSGALGALFGERKSSAVIDMLQLIGSQAHIAAFFDLVKIKACIVRDAESGRLVAAPKGRATRLQGFGHRIYKGEDPRVKIAKSLAFELFELVGKGEFGDLAVALEEAARSDEYFQSRGLFTNIDYWTAVVFHVLGFPADMFPVLTAVPRTAGLVAHWQESLDDPEYKIYRPRQVYIGSFLRDYANDRAALDVLSGAGSVRPVEDDGYVKSLPAQANKRLSLNPTTTGATDGIGEERLNEFRAMIARTQASIQEMAALTEGNSATKKKYSAWVLKKSQDSLESQNVERLLKTQRELEDLLVKQQELLDLYMNNRAAREASNALAPQVPQIVGAPTTLEKANHKLASEPDLLAGSHSPRPIMKKPYEH
ncbi:citrate synthase-like protein [Chytriomyces sp. MP71]|nr:citrate synthase-like protein [Chytriomyces sp. MP71]